MSVAEIWALKIARIRGVLRRHEKKPGMANVAAIGRCLGGSRWGGKVWGLLPTASAFAVPGAAKVPANFWFFIADFSEHWEWSIGDCGRFWNALWMHWFYVRVIQVITPCLWSWPFSECLRFPPGRQRAQRILINLTEVPGDFVARKLFEDKSLLQVLIKFNCINLFGAGIIILLRLCSARSDTGSSWRLRPPRCFLRQIAVVPTWCKAVLRMTVEGFSPPVDALEAFHLRWATWVEPSNLLLKTPLLQPALKEQIICLLWDMEQINGAKIFPEIMQVFVKEIEKPRCPHPM